jgi:hypothetical protein
VDTGVAADAKASEYDTQPIHLACDKGHLHIAEWLVEEHGVAVDAKNNEGVQPIHYACGNNHLQILKWLVEKKGASLAARTNYGRTPLHIACQEGYLAIVQWIVQQDSELVALRTNRNSPEWTWSPGYEDATPLRFAQLEGHKAVVNYLRTSPYYMRAEEEKAKAAKEKAKAAKEKATAKAAAEAEAMERADAMMAQLLLEEEVEEGKKPKGGPKMQERAKTKGKAKKKK